MAKKATTTQRTKKDTGVIEYSLDRYLAVKSQLKVLEDELEQLKPVVTSEVEKAGGKITHGGAQFSISERRTWGYSEECLKLDIELKAKQKYEQENGIAKVTKVTSFLSVR